MYSAGLRVSEVVGLDDDDVDRAGCVRIFVQSLPEGERWAAILDRLQRASGMGDDSLELSVS